LSPARSHDSSFEARGRIDEFAVDLKSCGLPGGDAVLFTVTKDIGDDQFNDAKIGIQPFTTGERNMVADGSGGGRYLPTGQLI
jgi:hypothetical protein